MKISAWLLILLFLPVSVFAVEEGGTRSVFAEGAGLRALAVGGAYAATADDASILFWNPGALGFLTRSEFQTAHASLYGLGMSEQHAVLTFPSWRWGVVGLGFRHFGVGGIEARDSRNLLLDEELSSRELEFSLGYGKTLSKSWSLGGNLKLRQHSLAGLSASGIGVDLGLLIRPAAAFGWNASRLQPLTLGLAMQGAVEPELRFDQESVRDPGALRLGLGYPIVLGPGRAIQVLLDLESPRGLGPRIHGGLEFNFSALALRAGYKGEALSSGLGLHWRDLSFDYLFEDNPLEVVHRFGMTFRFGASVEQRRQAALAREDDLLQTKLADAFQDRERQRIARLYAEALELYRAREYERALEALTTLNALAPEHEEGRVLTAHAFCGRALDLEAEGQLTTATLDFSRAISLVADHPEALAGLQRCREESDRRAARSADLRQRFATAMDDFSADRLVQAWEGFNAILDLEPKDHEAYAMLQRTEEAMRMRSHSYLEQARSFAESGMLAEARRFLDSARDFAPDPAELSAVEAAISRAEAEERRRQRSRVAAQNNAPTPQVAAANPVPASASPGNRVLSRKEQNEIEALYRQGMEAAEAGRGDDALRYWELVWSAQPGYQQVDSYLKREYLMRGMEEFAAGRLEAAAKLWESALRVDPSDDRAMGYLARAREQLARTQEILND